LAERAILEGGSSIADRAKFMFEVCTGRSPAADEMAVIVETYHQHLATYQADSAAAKQLAKVGSVAKNQEIHKDELAAWTMIGNLMLNLDEVITKN
jgi:hypothetical protein